MEIIASNGKEWARTSKKLTRSISIINPKPCFQASPKTTKIRRDSSLCKTFSKIQGRPPTPCRLFRHSRSNIEEEDTLIFPYLIFEGQNSNNLCILSYKKLWHSSSSTPGPGRNSADSLSLRILLPFPPPSTPPPKTTSRTRTTCSEIPILLNSTTSPTCQSIRSTPPESAPAKRACSTEKEAGPSQLTPPSLSNTPGSWKKSTKTKDLQPRWNLSAK